MSLAALRHACVAMLWMGPLLHRSVTAMLENSYMPHSHRASFHRGHAVPAASAGHAVTTAGDASSPPGSAGSPGGCGAHLPVEAAKRVGGAQETAGDAKSPNGGAKGPAGGPWARVSGAKATPGAAKGSAGGAAVAAAGAAGAPTAAIAGKHQIGGAQATCLESWATRYRAKSKAGEGKKAAQAQWKTSGGKSSPPLSLLGLNASAADVSENASVNNLIAVGEHLRRGMRLAHKAPAPGSSIGESSHQALETANCPSVAGPYYDKTGAMFSIQQRGCNITVSSELRRRHGLVYAGPGADEVRVFVALWNHSARLQDNGDIAWRDGSVWSLQPTAKDLVCEGTKHSLTPQEFRYARCPPGRYLSARHPISHWEKSKRLRKALCAGKKAGKVHQNMRESFLFKERGYMTYESAAWPKYETCLKNPAEHRGRKFSEKPFKSDGSPPGMVRLVNNATKLEYRKVWKSASSTLPRYLSCEFGAWSKVPAGTPPLLGHKAVVAVREPVERFVSATGEIMTRIINQFCISRSCGPSDGFDASTIQKVKDSSSWYSYWETPEDRRGSVFELVRLFVHDTACNYKYYASEHLNSQSLFVSQNSGAAAPLDVVIKLEEFDSGADELASLAGRERNDTCHLVPGNVAACKPNEGGVPTSAEIMKVLEDTPWLMKELCLIYAQDFVCFDYDLPKACQGLF